MIIYKITNNVNGKVYIGQTRHKLGTRKSQHLYQSRKCDSLDELNEKEREYIALFNSFYGNGKGYNMNYGDNSKKIFSEQTRERMSIAKSGENHPWFGKKRPEITKMLHENNPMKLEENKQKRRKTWRRISPQNETIVVDNIKSFCETNHLNLNSVYVNAHHNKKGKNVRYKGWHVSHITN